MSEGMKEALNLCEQKRDKIRSMSNEDITHLVEAIASMIYTES